MGEYSGQCAQNVVILSTPKGLGTKENKPLKKSKLHSLWYITDHLGALSAILLKGKYKSLTVTW